MTTNALIEAGFAQLIGTIDGRKSYYGKGYVGSGDYDLEIIHQPNEPIQIGTRNTNSEQLRGIITVMVSVKQKNSSYSSAGLYNKASEVLSVFKRGAQFGGAIVEKNAYIGSIVPNGDTVNLPITIRYVT